MTDYSLFGINMRLYQVQQFAANNGIVGTSANPLGPQNSIEHAYTSATLQRDYGAYGAIAEVLGNALEIDAAFRGGNRAHTVLPRR